MRLRKITWTGSDFMLEIVIHVAESTARFRRDGCSLCKKDKGTATIQHESLEVRLVGNVEQMEEDFGGYLKTWFGSREVGSIYGYAAIRNASLLNESGGDLDV